MSNWIQHVYYITKDWMYSINEYNKSLKNWKRTTSTPCQHAGDINKQFKNRVQFKTTYLDMLNFASFKRISGKQKAVGPLLGEIFIKERKLELCFKYKSLFFVWREVLERRQNWAKCLVYHGQSKETAMDGMECVLGRQVRNKVGEEDGVRCFITARVGLCHT